MQDKSLKPKILIYAYWKLAKAGNSNSYRTLHRKHWSSVWISEWLRDCTTSFFQKTIISGGSLASQNSKVEAWNSRLDPSISKLFCQQSHCWTPFTDKISNRLGLSDVTYSTEYSQRLTLESWFTNLEQMPINHWVDRYQYHTNNLLMDSSKTDQERKTAQLTIWLTIHKCLTVTIDGPKCTNDITSLHSL